MQKQQYKSKTSKMVAGTVTTGANVVVVGSDNKGTQKQKLQKKADAEADKKKKTEAPFATQLINKFFMSAVIDPGTATAIVDKNRVDTNNKIPSDDGPPRKQEEL